jgi:hypothetical protein
MVVLQISPQEMKAATSYPVSLKEKKLTERPAASEKGV